MTWRSCANNPPEEGKLVLVKWNPPYLAWRDPPHIIVKASWNWDSQKQKRRWVDIDGCPLPSWIFGQDQVDGAI